MESAAQTPKDGEPLTDPRPQPNWKRITASDVWREEILPMLTALADESDRALRLAPIEQVARLQGYAMAYRELIEMPEKAANFERMKAEYERLQQTDAEREEEARKAQGEENGETERNASAGSGRWAGAVRWGRRLAGRS